MFGVDFTTDVTDVKFRAVQWIVAEIFLFISIGMNYLNPKTYRTIFRLATGVIMLDFFLNIIWLPIGVSKTYGFQSAKWVFTETANETGAPPVWNWMLSYYVTAGVLVGFEASGHISEETQNASITAARGIFSAAAASCILGFPILILFLFCSPSLDVLYGFKAPQPFVGLYALSLGQGGQVFMTIICIIGLILVRPTGYCLYSYADPYCSEYNGGGRGKFASHLGCRSRWSSSFLWMDFAGLGQQGAKKRSDCNVGYRGPASLHHLALASGVLVSRQCCWCSYYHRICTHLL